MWKAMEPRSDLDDRAAAAFVDILTIFALVGAWSFGFAAVGASSRASQALSEAAVYVGAFLLLPPVFESRLGATPGKLLCGLRVVASDGRPPRAWAAFSRNFLKFGLAPLVLAAVVRRRPGRHDLMAGTRVIQLRSGNEP
jgi:uncharacterized RDD family membrane protein YckC